VGDATTASLALSVLARIALNTDVDEAIRLLREAIAVTDGTEDRDGRSSAMHVLGVAYQMAGRLEEARTVMSDRIALGRETGNGYLIAIESANLSMVERQLGNLEHAESLSLEGLEIVARRGDEIQIPWIVNGLAAVTAARGDLERAAVLNGFADAGIERAGGKWPPDERRQYEGTLELLRAGLAPEALVQIRDRGAAMSTDEAVAYALSAATGPTAAG
jgi:tetratricopeptide (TPR) repeat protein